MNFKERKIAGITCLEKTGDKTQPWIILLHGYGANKEDLASFAYSLNIPENVNWLFPEGILDVPIGPGFYGKAWFPIDMEALDEAMRKGQPRNLSNISPEGLKEARIKVEALLTALNVPFSQIILGGFSQGAMLSTDLWLHHKDNPLGLLLLSGSLLQQKVWKELAAKKESTTFLQSHGRQDQILGFQFAENLFSLLQNSGMDGQYIAFNGGHEIPPVVTEAMSSYIKSKL